MGGGTTVVEALRLGCKVIGIAEWDGSVYNPNGIQIEELNDFRKETGSIKNYPGAETLPGPDSIWGIPCDILIPAALELIIHFYFFWAETLQG